MAKKPKPKNEPVIVPLIPPAGGAVIRMYRIGHGDCFLIAFEGVDPAKPCFVLIDCGYKPGSPKLMEPPTNVRDIAADIAGVTGGFIDILVITHEHQDHIIGFTATNFPDLKVGKVWFSWTENPEDELANRLRRKHNDTLAWLIDASRNLRSLGAVESADAVSTFLEFELGEPPEEFQGKVTNAAAGGGKDPAASVNKQAMKFVVDRSSDKQPAFLYPHEAVRPLPAAKTARAFVLGPPCDEEKLDDLNPIGSEIFGDKHVDAAIAPRPELVAKTGKSPFWNGFVIPLEEARGLNFESSFFRDNYGDENAGKTEQADGEPILANTAWRRIDSDWANPSIQMALAMNNDTNNASLVLAFELSKGGKVLLFAADAQAGNWRSWAEATIQDGSESVSVQDLLGRAVVYKTGHHGSHNATLNGPANSSYPSLGWMGKGKYQSEFTAMITAVRKWAETQKGWDHPQPAIKSALLEKADGRVLQTDTPLETMVAGSNNAQWEAFMGRVKQTSLYFDLKIDP